MPGPVGGWAWTTENLQYALQYVPKEKLSLGIALYGYHWYTGDPGLNKPEKKPNPTAEYISYPNAEYLRHTYGGETVWDPVDHTTFFWFYRDQIEEGIRWAEPALAVTGAGDLDLVLNQLSLGLLLLQQFRGDRGREIIDEALAAYFRSLELEPDAPAVSLRVATLQLARKQTDQALARLDQVIEMAPEDPEAHHRRGLAHLALQHPTRAVADLRFAAEHLQDRPDVFYHLALALNADHKTADAIEATERALKLAPEYADARNLSTQLRR